MEPFLYRGDLILVQGGLNYTELNAAPKDAQPPGEVIVFYDPKYGKVSTFLPIAGKEARLIVHRAISKVKINGTWYFETKGDNNTHADSWRGEETWDNMISQRLIVGKVIGKVPSLGHIPLFMHENPELAILIIGSLFVILFFIDFIFPQSGKKPKS
jgi:signal peptidase I